MRTHNRPLGAAWSRGLLALSVVACLGAVGTRGVFGASVAITGVNLTVDGDQSDSISNSITNPVSVVAIANKDNADYANNGTAEDTYNFFSPSFSNDLNVHMYDAPGTGIYSQSTGTVNFTVSGGSVQYTLSGNYDFTAANNVSLGSTLYRVAPDNTLTTLFSNTQASAFGVTPMNGNFVLGNQAGQSNQLTGNLTGYLAAGNYRWVYDGVVDADLATSGVGNVEISFAAVPVPAAAGVGFSMLAGFGLLAGVRTRLRRRGRIV